ncbi:hypothetical protein CEP50_02825 [Actinopolyspora mortivallis]|uniref:Resolvase/invertase-type recombinase catalytic domain-containing protein n=1 Tax=Actinopolyspora mortivallis TaxID=33906 RepID=A0A2T0H0A7_ACTMO|nr:hypothetical protein CEP50_02825 [Actinopolyspora mortivallis]
MSRRVAKTETIPSIYYPSNGSMPLVSVEPANESYAHNESRKDVMSNAYADSDEELQNATFPVEHCGEDRESGTRTVIYLCVSSSGQVNRDYDPERHLHPSPAEGVPAQGTGPGLTVVDEYIEPGRSATEMTKREAFQRMLARVRGQGDVDYNIIVYQLSRMARNRYDDDRHGRPTPTRCHPRLRERVNRRLPDGKLMYGILATFNEYQSRQSGVDIANKTGQKPAPAELSAAPSSAISTTSTTQKAASSAPSSSTPSGHRWFSSPSSSTTPATTPSTSWSTNSTTAAYTLSPPPSTQRRKSRSTSPPSCCAIATTSATSPTRAKKSEADTNH